MDDKYLDYKGNEMKVGTRIFIDWEDDKVYGTVTQLDPQEGDADDEGRPIAYGPYVTVKFDDGVEDRYQGYIGDIHYETDPKDGYPYPVAADWAFDDVEVVS
jgi:hypothetical protein